MAAGLLWLLGCASSAHPPLRVTLVPHPEAFLERHQQVPPPHVLVGGHRRGAGCSRTSPSTPTTPSSCPPSWLTLTEKLCRTRIRYPVVGPLRLRRRRRGPHPGDDGKGTASMSTPSAGLVGRALPRRTPGLPRARSRSIRQPPLREPDAEVGVLWSTTALVAGRSPIPTKSWKRSGGTSC